MYVGDTPKKTKTQTLYMCVWIMLDNSLRTASLGGCCVTCLIDAPTLLEQFNIRKQK